MRGHLSPSLEESTPITQTARRIELSTCGPTRLQGEKKNGKDGCMTAAFIVNFVSYTTSEKQHV